MKPNTKTWLLMLALLPLASGVYGIAHDQITYSISSENFTHFKFNQFMISKGLRDSERLAAVLVGFLSTWWVGIFLAIPLGVIGHQKMNTELYRKSRISAVKTILLVVILFGVIGYFVGLIWASYISDWPVNIGLSARFPVFDPKGWEDFMITGMIHNFSYLGAVIGLLIALINQFRVLRRLSKAEADQKNA